MRTIISLISILFFLNCFSQEEKRLALVIGNSNYDKGELDNPVNDAYLISQTLASIGFDVIYNTNLETRSDFIKSVREFGKKRSQYDVAFVYYAGHGVQVNNENYLLPTKEEFENEEDVLDFGVSVQNILRYLESQSENVNVLILDACRDNPYESSWVKTRSLSQKGLAKTPPPTGSMIAYSTDPGNVAADGEGENSIYTLSLAKNIVIKDISIDQVFRNVRSEVLKMTNGQQRPVEATQLTGQTFYLNKVKVKDDVIVVNKLINDGKFENALTFLESSLFDEPSNLELLSLKLKILRLTYRINEALEIIKTVRDDDFKNESYLIEKIKILSDNKQYDEAVLFLEKLISLKPNNNSYLRELSKVYYNSEINNYDNLILNNISLSKENASKSNYGNDFSDIAYQFYLIDDHVNMQKYLDMSIKVNPTREQFIEYFTTSSKASFYLDSDFTNDDYFRKYQENLDYFSNNFESNYEILYYFAEHLYLKFLSHRDKRSRNNYIKYGGAEISQTNEQIQKDIKDLERIIFYYSESINLKNDFSPSYANRAVAYTDLLSYQVQDEFLYNEVFNKAISDYYKALDYYEKSYDNFINEESIPYFISMLYAENENYEMQVNELKKSIELYELNNKEVYNRIYDRLAVASYYSESYDDAIKYSNIAIPNAENDILKAYLYYVIGTSLVQQKKFKEAFESFKSSYDLNPSLPTSLDFFELAIFLTELDSAKVILENDILNNLEVSGSLYIEILTEIYNFKLSNNKTNSNFFPLIDDEILNHLLSRDAEYETTKILTNYFHLLLLNERFDEIIKLSNKLEIDDGFLFIEAISHYKKGSFIDSLTTMARVMEYLEYQVDLNFISILEYDTANKFYQNLKEEIFKLIIK